MCKRTTLTCTGRRQKLLDLCCNMCICMQAVYAPVHLRLALQHCSALRFVVNRSKKLTYLLLLQEWTALAKMVFRLKPLRRNNPPRNKTRLFCYQLIQTKASKSANLGSVDLPLQTKPQCIL